MKLKRVRIFGFKTFADRTEFSLEGNVIAVVGPNGCGKSNLVDAILWGLGEGNARQLRAQQGQDVIFNGSSGRKGVGFAEVTLTFDNEDGALPVEAAEVAVTRRLIRSGDNEYSINRRSCRQRDVYELLADSGLGRAGYAIVGQKEIDAALNASPEDRRAWIDEAAGVQRYRQRKAEAVRRLASAQDHLGRVGDILTELEAQREPLKEEAEVAARYRQLQATLREVEVGYLIAEVKTAQAELTTLEERITATGRLVHSESKRADQLEIDAGEARQRADRADREIDGAQSKRQDALTAREKAEAEVRLANQRLESLAEQERTLDQDRAEAAKRIEELGAEMRRLTQEEEAERATVAEIRIAAGGYGEEAARLSNQLALAEKALREARLQEAARLKSLAELAQRKERQALAKRELAGIDSSIPSLQAALQEAAETLVQMEAKSGSEVHALAEVEAQAAKLKAEEEGDARDVRSALAEKASLEGRRRGVEATIDSHEGLSQGSRAVLEAAGKGTLAGSYTPVGKAVVTTKVLSVAIETALGQAANDLIVPHHDQAKSAIEWLKRQRAGRATFQPITLMRKSSPSAELRGLLKESGVVGIASELVQCDPAHRPVIDSLLGRVLVVETIDDSLALGRTSGWSRLVTLDGEIVHSSGAVTGGTQARQGYGLIQRRADLDVMEKEIERLAETVAGFERRSAGRQAATQELAKGAAAIRQTMKADERERSDQRDLHRTIEHELKTSFKEREKLVRELEAPLPEMPGFSAEGLAESEAARDAALQALASKSADVEQTGLRVKEAQSRLDQATTRRQAAARRFDAAETAEAHRSTRAEAIAPERERSQSHLESSQATLLESQAEAGRLEAVVEGLRQVKQQALAEAGALTSAAKELMQNVGALADGLHQAELSRARADSRRASGLARLAEDYGVYQEDLDSKLDASPPPPDAPAIVQRLRREIRAMGDVNLGAIEAYDRLTARYEELDAQRADIVGGIGEVERSIKELDSLTADRFKSTFSLVQDAFSKMFAQLFGGGDGRIELTDAKDTLNSGIDLEVTLPGKRRQALALLSGGERALCTSAFLFALLSVKPSPLVVLDEVDAPLDGRNVERFVDTLLSFSGNTQFIVITHNPVTIKSAPVWLGVSMQEPGISHLVPVRLPEVSRSS